VIPGELAEGSGTDMLTALEVAFVVVTVIVRAVGAVAVDRILPHGWLIYNHYFVHN
jgi:hypothetical protein